MDYKKIKCLPKFKEELPPINRPNHSASSQVIKVIINKLYKCISQRVLCFQNYKELNKSTEKLNKIDPLILVTQYEKEINQIKINHSEMLKELHRELEILRTKNRGTMHWFTVNQNNIICIIY